MTPNRLETAAFIVFHAVTSCVVGVVALPCEAVAAAARWATAPRPAGEIGRKRTIAGVTMLL